MTPRARSITNTAITHHACQLLIEGGADAVTFAQVAQRCGLAPPTLVQRFATRDGMLDATAQALHFEVASAFGGTARSPSPLVACRTTLQQLAPYVAGALSLSGSANLAQFALELRKQISYSLASAVEAGELPHCDVAQLARAIQISVIGAVAVARLENGDAAAELGRAFDEQLAVYI